MIRITTLVKSLLLLSGVYVGSINVANAQLGAVKNYTTDKGSVIITTDRGSITITPYSDSIIEVLPRLSTNNLSTKSSASVVMQPSAKFSVSDMPKSININLKTLTISIDKSTALVSFNEGYKT